MDRTVLVVDDDEGQRELLRRVVGAEGFRVAEAKDGPEALRQAAALSPDAIVLDLMLPGTSGYEVLRQLQADGAGGIPVIVITARDLDRKAIDALRQEPNVRDFLPKPPRPGTLGARLRALLAPPA